MRMLCVLSLGLVMSCATTAMENEQRIPLPAAELGQEMSIDEALKQRRSIRKFGRDSIVLEDVSQLLWAAQGITSRRGFRTAPSAGALYPLELYLVAGNVTGLSPGVYHYRPKRHDLVLVASGDRRKPLASAALRQDWVRSAPAVLVITGVYQRTMAKYGQRGRRYLHMEVGHAAQNVYLQATARDLGTVMVGAFDDNKVQELLSLPADHEPLGLMPIGHSR
ncbi:MAG: SagB/ThcOx family dehydrogenase [Gammaproteobacteria bacterium]|nr:SagB/ThcOx family dehydrogenase [Gammaproteobacteria bacterium]